MISVPCLARFLLKNVNVAPYLLSLRVQSKKDLPKPQIWHKMTRLMSSKFLCLVALDTNVHKEVTQRFYIC